MPINPSLTDDEDEHKVLRPYRGKESDAIDQNIKLERGEIFIEYSDNGIGTGIGRMKMGDGSTLYRNLPYLFDQTDLSASFLKKFTPTTVTADNTLLGMIANNKNLATITAAEKKLIENRISKEGTLDSTISAIATKLDNNASSVSKLWSTVVTTTGTNDPGNGSNNGSTTGGKTANASLRSDINTLWMDVFNNTNDGVGNKELRKDINTNAGSITALQGATSSLASGTSSNLTKITALQGATSSLASGTSSNLTKITALQGATSSLASGTSSNLTKITALQGATSSLSTALNKTTYAVFSSTNSLDNLRAAIEAGSGEASSAIAKLNDTVFNNTSGSTSTRLANSSLRNDINNLFSTVIYKNHNNISGSPEYIHNGTTYSDGISNKCLREDINTLWNDVFNNAGGSGNVGNRELSRRIKSLSDTVNDPLTFEAGGKGNTQLRAAIVDLRSTVYDDTGNNVKKSGALNGTTQSSKCNEDLREDVNTLWLTVFNNDESVSEGKLPDETLYTLGNRALRKTTNMLNGIVQDQTRTTGSTYSGHLSTGQPTGNANINLRADINDLWSQVYWNNGNNDWGKDTRPSTVVINGNTALRDDVNSVWLHVFNNKDNEPIDLRVRNEVGFGVGNINLGRHIKNLESTVDGVDNGNLTLAENIRRLYTNTNFLDNKINTLTLCYYSAESSTTNPTSTFGISTNNGTIGQSVTYTVLDQSNHIAGTYITFFSFHPYKVEGVIESGHAIKCAHIYLNGSGIFSGYSSLVIYNNDANAGTTEYPGGKIPTSEMVGNYKRYYNSTLGFCIFNIDQSDGSRPFLMNFYVNGHLNSNSSTRATMKFAVDICTLRIKLNAAPSYTEYYKPSTT